MQQEKFGFIYIWFDKKRKRYYIGSHQGSVDDGYICSSNWMRDSYNRRSHDFKRRIIKRLICTRKELFEEENRWLSLIKKEELGKRYYNLHKCVHHWMSFDNSQTTLDRIKKNTKEAMFRPDVREKYLKGLKTRKRPACKEETKEKTRQTMLNTMAKKHPVKNRKVSLTKFGTKEHSELLAQKSRELWQRPGHREKVSKAISKSLKGVQNRLGHVNSEEHRRKISESQKGRKFSEEHKLNMKTSQKDYTWWNNDISEKKALMCPEGWKPGRIYRPRKKKIA